MPAKLDLMILVCPFQPVLLYESGRHEEGTGNDLSRSPWAQCWFLTGKSLRCDWWRLEELWLLPGARVEQWSPMVWAS